MSTSSRCGTLALLGLTVLSALVNPSVATEQPNDARPDAGLAGIEMQPALDGIFAAFGTQSLVGLDHTVRESLLIELVRDPRFARSVGNLVLEGGASIHQDIVNRYVAGEPVSYTELRQAWTDAIGPVVAGGAGYAGLFAAVREVNATLLPAQRIQVWMGEPSVNWRSATRDDVFAAMTSRDSHAASLILQQILAKGRKALVFYGGFHLAHEFLGNDMLRGRVEAGYPDAFFIVLLYSEMHRPTACDQIMRRAMDFQPAPVLVRAVQQSQTSPAMKACTTLDGADLVARGMLSVSGGRPPVIDADAVLFDGPPMPLTAAPIPSPEAFLDTGHRIELARRSAIGGPMVPAWPTGISFRRVDYEPGPGIPAYGELLDLMFRQYDRNRDGVVTEEEYIDPLAQ